MQKTLDFLHTVQSLVGRVIETQLPTIITAGELMGQCLMKEGYVYVFGTGHSHMMAEELFYRAGGHARIYPILDEGLMLHNGAKKSTSLERLEDYAEAIFDTLPCGVNDCLIIASNSGRNAVNIEMAQCARKRHMPVIALTSMTHSSAQMSRHSSGLKLFELADIVLDNQGCLGDASVLFEHLGARIGPTSTIIGATLLQAVAVSAAEYMLEHQYIPEIFKSSNLDRGDEYNSILWQKYRNTIKAL